MRPSKVCSNFPEGSGFSRKSSNLFVNSQGENVTCKHRPASPECGANFSTFQMKDNSGYTCPQTFRLFSHQKKQKKKKKIRKRHAEKAKSPENNSKSSKKKKIDEK